MICNYKILPYSSFEECRNDFFGSTHLHTRGMGADQRMTHDDLAGTFHRRMLAEQAHDDVDSPIWLFAQDILRHSDDELGDAYRTTGGETYHHWMLVDLSVLEPPVNLTEVHADVMSEPNPIPVTPTHGTQIVIFVKTYDELILEWGAERFDLTGHGVSDWQLRPLATSIGRYVYNRSMYDHEPIPVIKATRHGGGTVYIGESQEYPNAPTRRIVYEDWMIRSVSETRVEEGRLSMREERRKAKKKKQDDLCIITTFTKDELVEFYSGDALLHQVGGGDDWLFEYNHRHRDNSFCYPSGMCRDKPFLAKRDSKGNFNRIDLNNDTPNMLETYEPWMLSKVVPYMQYEDKFFNMPEYEGYLVVSPKLESDVFKRRSLGILTHKPHRVEGGHKLIHLKGDGTWELV